jgi:hypothetical protein
MSPTTPTHRLTRAIALELSLLVLAAAILPAAAHAQTAFDVATIRPSAGQFQFERSGKTVFDQGTLTVRDVTVASRIELAYGSPSPSSTPPSKTNRASN